MRPAIDPDRLWARLMALGEIGAFDHPPTGRRGVNRLALTASDAAGRRQVIRWMEAEGLEVSIDQVGNVYGTRPGADPGADEILIGSHIDSVPTGGAFDGALGVVAGLEVLAALREAGFEARRPLTVAFFTEEEGARFGTDMLGSAVACGRIAIEDAWALKDRDGISVREALEQIGFLADAPPRRAPPRAFLELHVEQGPVLHRAGIQIGAVTGVQAISWRAISVQGRAAHAGTTPMSMRADALAAAARIALAAREMACSGDYGAEARATVGVLQPAPGRINVVPDRVEMTLDLRNPDEGDMRRLEAAVDARIEAVAAEEGVAITWRQTARTAPVAFDPALRAQIVEAAGALDLSCTPILSGAGHDAQEFAAIGPAAMIFIPGERDGISHNPLEYSTPEACAAGASVLLRVVAALAMERGP